MLGQPEAEGRDVVVLTVRVLGQGHGTPGMSEDQMFSDYEQTLFTRVVAIAERHGRRVTLLVTPGTNIFDALAQSAVQLRSGLIVVGESEIMTPEQQAHLLGEAWDRTPHDLELSTRFLVLRKDGRVKRFSLGAHLPDLSSDDIDRIHRLWVEAVKAVGPEIHHRDVVTAALSSLEEELHDDRTERRRSTRLRRQTRRHPRPERDSHAQILRLRGVLSAASRLVTVRLHARARRHQRHDRRADLPARRPRRGGDVAVLDRGRRRRSRRCSASTSSFCRQSEPGRLPIRRTGSRCSRSSRSASSRATCRRPCVRAPRRRSSGATRWRGCST